MGDVAQDVRYAFRTMRRNPAFAVVVIATLALGIGANTSVFSVVNATLLEPLPYPSPDRLVRLYWWEPEGEPNYLPGAALVDYRDNLRSLEALGAIYTYAETGADLTGGDRPQRLRTLRVGADYFPAVGVRPVLGRAFYRSEDREGVGIAVVSQRVWQEALGGRDDALGRSLMLDGVAHEVVGVMPAGFEDPLEAGVDVWLPQTLELGSQNNWDNMYLSAIGRLRPGVTLAEAQAEVDVIASRQREHFAEDDEPPAGRLMALHEDLAGGSRPLLFVLTGAVVLLLLIACVNVASLVLARGASRQTELAVRAALGSSRLRLARQLLIESVILAALGGAAGVALAALVTRALLAVAPATLARGEAGFDAAVFAYAFIAAVLSGVVFGLAPVLHFSRPALAGILRGGGRGGDTDRRQLRVRNALVVAEVALALTLLIGAGILLRSFEQLRGLDLGLQPENVWTFQVNLPSSTYDPAARARFHEVFQERVEAVPGVRAAGAISRLPVTGIYHGWGTRRVASDGGEERLVGVNQRVVEGDYFAAAGIPLMRGRTFGPEDHADAPRRVVVSEALVASMFGDENPLGARLRIPSGGPAEIIGVVGDVPISARGDIVPMAYHSHGWFATNRNWALTQVVAVDRPRSDIVNEVRSVLAGIDPDLVLHEPRPLADVIGRGVATERFALLLVSAFAVLALTLAAIGLYGLLAYSVARRRREIGIRLALGARPARVRYMIVGHGARLAGAGLAIGLVVAIMATRALSALVYGVSVRDPIVFLAATVVLAVVAIAASWIPAFWATRVDPLEAFAGER
jgi:predicted permease